MDDSETGPPEYRLTTSWQATGAAEYQYAIDQRANWTPWTASPLATVPLAVNVNTVTLYVRARASAGFAYVEASDTWTRPAVPVTGPPTNLRLSLRVVGSTWTASWSAESSLQLSYSYQFIYTDSDGESYEDIDPVAVGQSQIASGTIPEGALSITVRVVATDPRDRSIPAQVTQQLSPSPPASEQVEAPADEPVFDLPDHPVYADPQPSAPQSSALQGTPGLAGLTLIRHSLYGQRFTPL